MAQYNLGQALTAEGEARSEHFAFEDKLMAASLVRQEGLAAACKHYQESVRLMPDFTDAQVNLAGAYLGLHKPELALERAALAARQNPALWEAQAISGSACLKLRRSKDAVRYFTKAIQLSGGNADLYSGLGWAQGTEDRWSEAVSYFEKAVDLDPSADRFCELAHALRRAGRIAAAQDNYARALRMDPNWPKGAARQAWLLATSAEASIRDGTLALQLAQQACEAGPPGPEVLDSLAAALAETGDFQGAVDAATRAIALVDKQELSREIRERLRLYQARLPFRQQNAG